MIAFAWACTTFASTAACETTPRTSVAVATTTPAFCAPVGTAAAAVRTFTHSIVAIAATEKSAATIAFSASPDASTITLTPAS